MARILKEHSPAFKAKVALETAKQAKTTADFARQFQVHPVQISQWKKQLLPLGDHIGSLLLATAVLRHRRPFRVD